MQAFFLERPIYLIPVAILVQAILLSRWLSTRTERSRRMAIVGAIVLSALVALQALVETDRERIGRVCQALARSVERADAAAFADQLSPGFETIRKRGPTLSREIMIDEFRRVLRSYKVEEIRLRGMELKRLNGRAEMSFRSTCRVMTPSEQYPSIVCQWTLEFVEHEGSWKLDRIGEAVLEPVKLDVLDEVL